MKHYRSCGHDICEPCEFRPGAEVVIFLCKLLHVISFTKYRVAVVSLENSHNSKIHCMCKIVGHPWFLTDKDYIIALHTSGVLLKSQEIISQLRGILYIKLGNPQRTILKRLYNKSKRAGLVECVVIEVPLLLGFVQRYNITLLGTGISKGHRGSCCIEQARLFHDLHTDKTCTGIIMCEKIRMEEIYPAHQLIGLIRR